MFSAVHRVYVYKSYGMQANLKVGHSCLPQCNCNYSPAVSHRKTQLNLCGAAEVGVLNTVPWLGGSEDDREGQT